jgi:GNAT superfamily N-acetyltransferase
MEVREHEGLRIGYVDPAEVLSRSWQDCAPPVAVVRVSRPEPALWPELERVGFSVKPAWLTWLRLVPSSDQEFLDELPRDAARSFQRGRCYGDSGALRLEQHFPSDAGILDAFLELYQTVITTMERGVLFAMSNRTRLLENLDNTVIILTYHDGQLVGGSLCEIHPRESMLYVRYHVVLREARRTGLAWAIYLHAFRFARSAGLRVLSLGSDPNLYGHLSGTGLFYVKHRLGFRAVPSQVVTRGSDEADLVLRLDVLTDPTLIVCYDIGRPADRVHLFERPMDVPRLRAELFHQRRGVPLKMFQAGFLTDLRLRSLSRARCMP